MEEIKKIDIIEPEKQTKRIFGKKKWVLVPFLVLVVIAVIVGINGYFVYASGKEVVAEAKKLQASAKTKDLKQIADQITETKRSLSKLEGSLKPLAWVGVLPFVGSYQKDAFHLVKAGEAGLEAGEITVTSITPYADLIGFTGGAQVETSEKKAADRINLVVTTLDKVSPDIDKVGEKLQIVKRELDQIDPNRYPTNFRGQKVREPLAQAISVVDEVSALTNEAKPLLKNSSWLFGVDAPRRYLVLFQNDGELRPTGGFVTAYALLEVEKGKVKPILSDDIYEADSKYKPTKTAPEQLVQYVQIPYKTDSRWRLRDMNMSPDFKTSMELFSPEFAKATNMSYDGIIGVDTEFLVSLLRVLGQIGVPGLGNFSADPDSRCDGCPQVVFQLENLITKPLNRIVSERKAVLGPLMNSILANALGSPKEKLPDLFETAYKSVTEKHVVFYFPEEKIQSAVEAFNLAGQIRSYDGDYLHLNDTNFAGAKVNMFIKEEVDQKIEIAKDGTVVKTVSITYKNPSPPSDCNLERGGLCLNASYRDWVRLYVPEGSKLIESNGLETDIKTYNELGKTVFEGFFGDKYPLRPLGQAKISFKYQLPGKFSKNYNLLIQKQAGTDGYIYTVDMNGRKSEFELKTDKELKFKI